MNAKFNIVRVSMNQLDLSGTKLAIEQRSKFVKSNNQLLFKSLVTDNYVLDIRSAKILKYLLLAYLNSLITN